MALRGYLAGPARVAMVSEAPGRPERPRDTAARRASERVDAALALLERVAQRHEPCAELLPETLAELRRAVGELQTTAGELDARLDELDASEGARDGQGRHLTHLFDDGLDALLVTDRRHRIREASGGAARLLQRPVAALLEQPVTLLLPPGRRLALRQRLGALLRGDGVGRWQIALALPGGGALPVRIDAAPVHDADGAVAGLRWTLRDERELQTTREALHAADARYRAIVETALEGIVTTDPEGVVLSINPAACRMLGYEADEVLGRNVSVLMPMPYREQHDAHIRRYVTTRKARIVGTTREVEGRRRDGGNVPLLLSVSCDGTAERPVLVGVFRDLTGQKLAETMLHRHEQMVSTTADLMCFVGTGYVYLAANTAYCEAFDLPRERIVGATVAEVQGQTTFEELLRPRLDRALAGTPVDYEEWRDLPGHGRCYLHAKLVPYREPGGRLQGVVVDVRDLTELRRMADELERHRDELTHVARLSVLGELASGIAHELNQPLAAIASYCDGARRLLEREPPPGDELRHALQQSSAQAQRAGQIIRRMRNLARKGDNQRSSVDVNEHVANIILMLRNDARRRRTRLVADTDSSLPKVRADPIQLEQVVLNLVRNALEAVDAAARPLREVTVRTRRRNGGVEVSVEDTGPGLGPHAETRVFDAFYTTKPGGMGIGLSICRRIIEAHGGRVTANERDGGGAVFRFTLPAKGGTTDA